MKTLELQQMEAVKGNGLQEFKKGFACTGLVIGLATGNAFMIVGGGLGCFT